MACATGMADGGRLSIQVAMQMSRSVIIPITCPSALTTGSAPQSQSHINLAAAASDSSARQEATFLVMSFSTFTLMAMATPTRKTKRAGRASPSAILPADAPEDAPVVWIVDAEHWPRAYLRAELIERGYDAVGFVGVREALARF